MENQTLDVFPISKHALGDTWNDLWAAVVCSLAWVLSLVIVLPAPPVTFGLFYLANRVAHGEVTDLKDLLEGVRRYWKISYAWGLLNLAVLLFLAWDYRLIGQMSEFRPYLMVQGLYLALAAFWLLWQLYALPFFFEQEQPALKKALRNGLVMIGKNPLFSALLFLLIIVILLLGTLLFMVSVAVGGYFIACLANRAVLNRLAVEHKPNQ